MPPSVPSSAPRRQTALRSLIPSASSCQPKQLWNYCQGQGEQLHGSSKAALEMTTEIWAKELADTGVTVNIVNPGAGANTPGMAQEMRARSAAGPVRLLVEP